MHALKVIRKADPLCGENQHSGKAKSQAKSPYRLTDRQKKGLLVTYEMTPPPPTRPRRHEKSILSLDLVFSTYG